MLHGVACGDTTLEELDNADNLGVADEDDDAVVEEVVDGGNEDDGNNDDEDGNDDDEDDDKDYIPTEEMLRKREKKTRKQKRLQRQTKRPRQQRKRPRQQQRRTRQKKTRMTGQCLRNQKILIQIQRKRQFQRIIQSRVHLRQPSRQLLTAI